MMRACFEAWKNERASVFVVQILKHWETKIKNTRFTRRRRLKYHSRQNAFSSTRLTKSAFKPSVLNPLLAKSSFSSFTVRLLVSVFLFSPFASSATVWMAGSTEALLERREERLDGGGGGGAGEGEGDLDRVVRFLFGGDDGFSSSSSSSSVFVEIGGARGGGKGTSISFSSGIVSGMFFGFSFSSSDGFFAGSLIVHGAKSLA
jgi:hypothetical protein